jgi:hypothetical protein
MALIGKSHCGSHINRLVTTRQQLSGLCQAQLNKPCVWRQVELALKTARQGKAIRARLARKV